MKKDIHPKYYRTKVTCACGNTFETGSTKPEIRVEICSKCHPFFTGKEKFIDTAGRIEKFTKKYDAARKREEMHRKQRELIAKAAEEAAMREAASKAGVDEEVFKTHAETVEAPRLETLSEIKAAAASVPVPEAETDSAVEPEAPAPVQAEPVPQPEVPAPESSEPPQAPVEDSSVSASEEKETEIS